MSPFRDKFLEAMDEEVTKLSDLKSWVGVKRKDVLARGYNILQGTWVFCVKRLPWGEIYRYRAHFVARGDQQKEGVDVFETYVPTIKWSTVRAVLLFALQNDMATRMIDVPHAFLQAHLSDDEHILWKSLQGLKTQLEREWY